MTEARPVCERSAQHLEDLCSDLIRLHILHHAARESIFGLGIIDELGRHGYRLSAGAVYPLLHGLERSLGIDDLARFTPSR